MDKKVNHSEQKDKQVRRRRKLDHNFWAKVILVVGLVGGIAAICVGSWKIHGLYEQVGTKSVEELGTELDDLSAEYARIEKEKTDEIEKNGYTDKYVELNNRSAEVSAEITRATNSRYMKETGYNNPQSLGDMLRLAPELWIGVLLVATGLLGHFVLRTKTENKK